VRPPAFTSTFPNFALATVFTTGVDEWVALVAAIAAPVPIAALLATGKSQRIMRGSPFLGASLGMDTRLRLRWISPLLPNLHDRRIQDDVRVAEGQLALLREPGDLVVLDEEHRLHSGLPGDEELLPERVVVVLPRLGAEDGQLAR